MADLDYLAELARAAIDSHLDDPTTAVKDPLPPQAQQRVAALRDEVAGRYGIEVAGWVMLRWHIERLAIADAIEAELADPTPNHLDDPTPT